MKIILITFSEIEKRRDGTIVLDLGALRDLIFVEVAE